jgi:ADP-ribose pyrophosphatase
MQMPEENEIPAQATRRPAGLEAQGVVCHQGEVIRVEQYQFEIDGRQIRKDVVRHPGAITVIPIEADGAILMVEVGRLAVGRMLLEFCAGKLEPEESPLIAAGRELEEEVGRRAGHMEPIGAYFTSPGFCDERMHAFVATDLSAVPQRLELGEEIEVVRMTPELIDRAIFDGRIDDGKTITAWHLFRAKHRDGGP